MIRFSELNAMKQDQRNKKAEQLRLAARIIETGCGWEIERVGMGWLDSGHINNAQWGCPLDAINHGFPIRIKEPVIPVAKPKKRVPLGPEDITPGTCIKPSNEYVGWGMVCEVDSSGIHLFASRHLSWNELMNNNWSIKRPTDTEWMPCFKEAP